MNMPPQNPPLPPPDFATPEGRAAYKAELHGVARPIRLTGNALAIVGVAGGLARYVVAAPPAWLPPAALALAVAGLALMLTGIVLRTRYHLRRLQGR